MLKNLQISITHLQTKGNYQIINKDIRHPLARMAAEKLMKARRFTKKIDNKTTIHKMHWIMCQVENQRQVKSVSLSLKGRI